jgi:MraZ protein
MLKSSYEYTLDEKFRAVFPADLRKRFAETYDPEDGMVLVLGDDGVCIDMHPAKKWEADRQREWDEYDHDDPLVRDYFRIIFASVVNVSLDKMSRFVIPESMRQRVGIEKDILFIGINHKVEIWDRGAFRAFERKAFTSGKPKKKVPQTPPSTSTMGTSTFN